MCVISSVIVNENVIFVPNEIIFDFISLIDGNHIMILLKNACVVHISDKIINDFIVGIYLQYTN